MIQTFSKVLKPVSKRSIITVNTSTSRPSPSLSLLLVVVVTLFFPPSIADNQGFCPISHRRTLSKNMATKAMSSVSIIPFESLHVSTPTWWLESRFHFSFADYWDPKRSSFGCLRVMNDDYIKGEAGFGTHPHRDMEIFTYVADGELSHGDSMGNMQTLVTGDVQYLSAGTGITHSEMNRSKKTAHIIQTWLIPDRKGHTPQYGQTSYQPSDRADRLLHIISGTKSTPEWPNVYSPSAIALHQDVNVYVSQSRAGTTFDLSLAAGRQSYLLCIEGSLSVNGTKLRGKDAAKVLSHDASPTSLKLEAGEPNAHFMLIEMAKAD